MKSRILTNILLFVIVVSIFSCKRDYAERMNVGNCYDGKLNQDEESIDCGGFCVPCSDCSNGIKDLQEEGIDCGEDCRSCDADCSIALNKILYNSTTYNTTNTCATQMSDQHYVVTITEQFSNFYIRLEFNEKPTETRIYRINKYDEEQDEDEIYVQYNGSWNGAFAEDETTTVHVLVNPDGTLTIKFCELRAASSVYLSSHVKCN